jgi:DNA polymerase
MTIDLDARRRAMLLEMNVRVWDAPRAAEPAVSEAAPAAAAQAAAQTAQVLARAAAGPAPQPARSLSVAAGGTPRQVPSTVGEGAPVPAAAAAVTAPLRPSGVDAMDWAALESAVAGCQACKLCTGRRNTVFGVGARQADWLIVGEAPGEEEDKAGEPFVGPSGKLLDNMLAAVGLSRRGEAGGGVYIANVLKCRPPGNRNPQPEEVAQCEPFLRRQVELIQPRIILALGRFAAQSLLQSAEPIGKLRGQVHRFHGVPVIVSYHPAYLLRSLPEKAKAWADLCLAQDVMKRGG